MNAEARWDPRREAWLLISTPGDRGHVRSMFEALPDPTGVAFSPRGEVVWEQMERDTGESVIEHLNRLNRAREWELWLDRRHTTSVSGTEARVVADICERQKQGTAKYGTTVAVNSLPLRAWLQHAYEECLDQAVYLRRAIEEMDGLYAEVPSDV